MAMPGRARTSYSSSPIFRTSATSASWACRSRRPNRAASRSGSSRPCRADIRSRSASPPTGRGNSARACRRKSNAWARVSGPSSRRPCRARRRAPASGSSCRAPAPPAPPRPRPRPRPGGAWHLLRGPARLRGAERGGEPGLGRAAPGSEPCRSRTGRSPAWLPGSGPALPASATNLLNRLNPAFFSSKFGSICCMTCFSRSDRMTSRFRAIWAAASTTSSQGSRWIDGVSVLPGQAGEVVVGVVLVAILDQQVAGRLADPDADHVLPVLLQLDDHRREVAVAREQDERADLGAGEHQLDRVNGKPDVRRVLLVGPEGRGEDQVDRRLGEGDDVLGIPSPVGVGPLDGDLAPDDLAPEKGLQFLGQIRADPQGDVVEVDEQRRIGRVERLLAAGGRCRCGFT